MKKSDNIEINWESLGATFANMGDDDQAKFFKGLARELMHWDSDHRKELQFFSVSDGLTDKDKEQLEIALKCLWWEE